jgi:transcriptional regulator with XRE-family HTH domain
VQSNPKKSDVEKQVAQWRRTARKVIAATRDDKDLTQEAMAAKLHWSRSKLAKTESGRRELRFVEFLLMAQVLNESPEVLLRRILRW